MKSKSPIIALENETYLAMCCMYPKRIIICISHPTSSFDTYAKLWKNKKENGKNAVNRKV
jgi:hypothetical protein